MNDLILDRLHKLSEEIAFLKKENADLKKAVFLIQDILSKKKKSKNKRRSQGK